MSSSQPESYDAEAVRKLQQLIESTEEANLTLAIQIIESHQLASALITHLYAVATFTNYPTSYKAWELLETCLPKDKTALLSKVHADAIYQESEAEKKANVWLTLTEDIPEVDTPLFAQVMIKFKEEGFAYCIKKQVMPIKEVLRIRFETYNGYELNFDHFGLDELPAEVGLFTQATCLSIVGNNFKTLPDTIANLTQLESIYFYYTPLSKTTLKNLEKWIPKAMAYHYASKASDTNRESNPSKAFELIQKAHGLDPTHLEYINQMGIYRGEMGYELESIKYYDQAIQINPDSLLAYINKSDTFLDLKLYKKAIKVAEEGLSRTNKTTSSDNLVFLYFKKAYAYHHLDNFSQAQQYYDKVLHLDSNHIDSNYNMACLHAKQHKKELMLQYLSRAIQFDNNYRLDAPQDEDFKSYWQDAEFIALVKAE